MDYKKVEKGWWKGKEREKEIVNKRRKGEELERIEGRS